MRLIKCFTTEYNNSSNVSPFVFLENCSQFTFQTQESVLGGCNVQSVGLKHLGPWKLLLFAAFMIGNDETLFLVKYVKTVI